MQLEGMARHHQVEVRDGKTRQWAQMAAFKLYEHGTDITLKHVVKKKGKESGNKEPIVTEDPTDVHLNEGGNVSVLEHLPGRARRWLVRSLILPRR